MGLHGRFLARHAAGGGGAVGFGVAWGVAGAVGSGVDWGVVADVGSGVAGGVAADVGAGVAGGVGEGVAGSGPPSSHEHVSDGVGLGTSQEQ